MGNYLDSITVGSGVFIENMFGGEHHRCIISDEFKIKCFGQGDDGVLVSFECNYNYILLRSNL